MAVDLYTDDLSGLSNQQVYDAIEAFTRLADPVDARPREGFVLDFKQDWSDSALSTVAAFSHTFGGLLFVGVSESSGRPDKFVGIEGPGELKTKLASSIATNISPTPSFEIAECGVP